MQKILGLWPEDWQTVPSLEAYRKIKTIIANVWPGVAHTEEKPVSSYAVTKSLDELKKLEHALQSFRKGLFASGPKDSEDLHPYEKRFLKNIHEACEQLGKEAIQFFQSSSKTPWAAPSLWKFLVVMDAFQRRIASVKE
tara:strand:- start:737 stop:1153 length:417 start_codon:yes stop_codon:yes gene_type:complete